MSQPSNKSAQSDLHETRIIISLLGFASATPEYQDLALSLVSNQNLKEAEVWAFEADQPFLEGASFPKTSDVKLFTRVSDLVATLQEVQTTSPVVLNPLGLIPIKSFTLPTVGFVLSQYSSNLWAPIQAFGTSQNWDKFSEFALGSSLLVYCSAHASRGATAFPEFREFVDNLELQHFSNVIEASRHLREADETEILSWLTKSKAFVPSWNPEAAPLVSVVTPSFNHARFINKTIQSVLGQSYPNFEYIVVDGGSQDGTLEILKSYGDQIMWISEPDRGYADAVRKGFQRARGKYFCWVPSDDEYFNPDSLSTLVSALEESAADVVYGNCIYINEESQWLGHYRTSNFDVERLRNWCLIPQPSTLFSSKIYHAANGISPDLVSVADYDLWLRIAESGGRFLRLGRTISKYRLHSTSITASRSGSTYAEIIRMQRERYGNVFPGWIHGAIGEVVHHLKGRPQMNSPGYSQATSPNRFRALVRSNVVEPLVRRIPVFQSVIAVILNRLSNY